jgi:predicted esterase
VREINVPVTTHGRVLIDDADQGAPLKLFVGCHGYGQNADGFMELLRGVPVDASWTRVSIQALHRFYRGRLRTTVASWMTRQDRELLIGDNVAYVDAAIAQVSGTRAVARLALCGFSQGVAMAFRAGLLGARRADAVLALGGDVPPELLADAALTFPRVLLARGAADDWYAAEKLLTDEAALQRRGTAVETLTFDGMHEWNAQFASRAADVLASL